MPGLREIFEEPLFQNIKKGVSTLAEAVRPPFGGRSFTVHRGGRQVFEQEKPQIVEKKRGVTLAPQDINELRRVVFSEISNRGPEKKDLETRVLLNTALNRVAANRARGRNMTLAQVLRQPNQYQGVGTPLYRRYDSPGDKLTKERKKQVDRIVDQILEEIEKGSFEDNTDGSYFYRHVGDKIYYEPGPLFK